MERIPFLPSPGNAAKCRTCRWGGGGGRGHLEQLRFAFRVGNHKLSEVMALLATSQPHSNQRLRWVLHLRWVAVAVQASVCLAVILLWQYSLPLPVIGSCMAAVVLSNLWLLRRDRVARPEVWIAAILCTDIILLTIILYFAGGAHNPFTLLYLLHVTMAVVLLSPAMAWGVLGLSTLGFASLFLSDAELQALGVTCCNDFQTHLLGMLAATFFTGSGIVYFVDRLNRTVRQLDRELEQARRVNDQQQRFASIATLAAGVAHELATPLSTISVAAEEFEQQACRQCGREECLADARLIRQEVGRCCSIIDTLRVRENTESVELAVNPANLPEMLQEMLPSHISRRMVCTWQGAEHHLQLPLARLLQALSILLKNAAEASPPEQPIGLHIETSAHAIVFRIVDQGCGIESNHLDRLGEPFFTTKADTGGMGLGLFLVRRFVDEYRGAFQVESRPGHGTTITLRLTATASPHPAFHE